MFASHKHFRSKHNGRKSRGVSWKMTLECEKFYINPKSKQMNYDIFLLTYLSVTSGKKMSFYEEPEFWRHTGVPILSTKM